MEKDPYAEGREAHDAGKPETANPYDMDDLSDDENAMAWNDGWNAAAEDAAEDDES